MYKQIAGAIALTLASGAAFAGPPSGTVGVGVAHTQSTLDDGNTIFVPITLENNWWVEPFVAYASEEINSGPNEGNETTGISVGSGVFKNVHTTAKTRAYLGGRLGYTYFENDPSGSSSTDDSGFLVQPTVGFGYEPVDNLMFGAEAFLTYQDSDIQGVESLGTGTSLFARYYFTR